jgi:hypothetical protein
MYKSKVISWLNKPETNTRLVLPKAVDSRASAMLVTVALVHWSVNETLLTITPGLERYVEVAMG